MQPPLIPHYFETIEGISANEDAEKRLRFYHVTDDGYQGLVTQESLQDAVEDSSVHDFSEEIYEEVPAVLPDAVIEEVLPDTMFL